MNTSYWIHHFESNARRTIPLPSQPCTLPESIRRSLADSLAVFQLGESGGGTRLRAYARKIAPLENFRGYQRAIDLFIAEEQGHAALLARVLHHVGTQPLQRQWTNTVFRSLRGWINLEFTIQILLTAELIAEIYYGTLYLHTPDATVRTMAHSILRDEMKHLDFQADFLSSRLRELTPLQRRLWHWQFTAIHWITSRIVAWDHRHCLQALDIPRAAFHRRCAQAMTRFRRRLSSRIQSGDPLPSSTPSHSTSKIALPNKALPMLHQIT